MKNKIEWTTPISDAYIAGFFDGEGSAMILTIRRINNGKIYYRFRPTITIAQKHRFILDKIFDKLKIGNVIYTQNQCCKLQINGNKKILSFIEQVGEYIIIKKRQINTLRQIIKYQNHYSKNIPYTKADILQFIKYRDTIHAFNKLNNPKLKQKYIKKQIMSEHHFVNIEQWKHERNKKTTLALIKHNISTKLPRIKIKCACGCGKDLVDRDNKARLRKYINGHNQKGKHWRWKKLQVE